MNNRKLRYPQWLIIYSLLAALNVIVILFSLTLTRSMMSELNNLASQNQQLNTYLQDITQLQRLSMLIIKPTVTLFSSQDLALERRLFNNELINLHRRVNTLNTAFKNDSVKPEMLTYLDTFNNDINEIVTKIEQEFSHYENGNKNLAAMTMSQITERYHLANINLNKLRTEIHDIQTSDLTSAADKLKLFNQFTAILLLAVISLIIAISLYGHLLAKKLRTDEIERNALLMATRNDALMLNGIFESTADGIITYNHQGEITSANSAAEHIFGRNRAEMLGKSVLSILADTKNDKYSKALSNELKAVSSAPVRDLRITAQRKDGTTFPISVSINTSQHTQIDGERVHLFTAIVRDITAKHKNKRMLQKALQDAQAAAVAKDEFLATVSHEIRTPMNGVIGASELLYHTKMGTEQIELVDIIHSSSNALMVIINDILEFSRIQAGTMEFESIPFDAKALAEEVVNLYKIRAHKQHLAIELKSAEKTDFNLIGDPTRIRQILLNLVNNAVKFTHEGSVEIYHDIVTKNEQTYWRCSIKDTGIGISPDEIPYLFQRFTQADSSTTRLYGGTGLGLAISQQLAELMYGNISVASQIGKGSTFTLEVPATSTSQTLPKTQMDRPKRNYGLSVLLVEDNQVNQIIASRLLHSFGIQATSTSDGQECLNVLGQQNFDAVLMDMQMPIMDGITATKAIRSSQAQNADIPIIAMTANALEKDRQLCFQAGMNGFLSKPLDPKAMVEEFDHIFLETQ